MIRQGGSSRNSEYALLFRVGCRTDEGPDLVKEPTLKGPISVYLVSHELSLDDRAKWVKRLLVSQEEQESAKRLEPANASKFVELLDQVHFPSSQLPMFDGK